ncbi:4113_t:CDS:2 [Funneliformis geosporum]|uniref:4701_t:CDS:1 n=1 Tax=Funneliformis geosporum TaxID=1117311 RepID=A0A9W4WTB2_9GLOM|nr:4113_t:CDS:2 [Funneliformis geosporum]CAI2170619.1 4701_t:CDS:2 [Funneliformis geosporum]
MPIIPSIQTEKIDNDNEFEIKPTIKKTCARCKESNRCVKLVCSRIHRLEDLVKNIVRTTETSSMNVNNYNTFIKEQQPQIPSPISQVFINQSLQLPTPLPSPIQAFSSPPNSISSDLSNYSLEELQKVVSVITNAMNRTDCVKPNSLHAFSPCN